MVNVNVRDHPASQNPCRRRIQPRRPAPFLPSPPKAELVEGSTLPPLRKLRLRRGRSVSRCIRLRGRMARRLSHSATLKRRCGFADGILLSGSNGARRRDAAVGAAPPRIILSALRYFFRWNVFDCSMVVNWTRRRAAAAVAAAVAAATTTGLCPVIIAFCTQSCEPKLPRTSARCLSVDCQ